MEIRIVLDRVEPPVGRLVVGTDSRRALGGKEDIEIGFTGWLGMLKALYDVTGEPGAGPQRGP
ncbi:MAG TPA: hypothetical protein VLW50_03070 [Streptosporangiaceae bacterium]|nr:hypothetical protein [Streptosporangiaceae bacterium]